VSTPDRSAARSDRQRAKREAKWAATPDEDLLRMRINESVGDLDLLTSACLGVAVPLWIELMRPWDPERRERTGRELVDTIAFDPAIAAMVDGTARESLKRTDPGKLTKAFNAVAQGVACLAFCAGGVVFAGQHWKATGTPP
jgi:hypothetical protein